MWGSDGRIEPIYFDYKFSDLTIFFLLIFWVPLGPYGFSGLPGIDFTIKKLIFTIKKAGNSGISSETTWESRVRRPRALIRCCGAYVSCMRLQGQAKARARPGPGQGQARAGPGQGRARVGPGQGRARPGRAGPGQASEGILKASRLDFRLPGASGGFQA